MVPGIFPSQFEILSMGQLQVRDMCRGQKNLCFFNKDDVLCSCIEVDQCGLI